MSKFKVGDRVRRITQDHAYGLKIGEVGKIDSFVSSNPHIEGEDVHLAHAPEFLELVAPTSPVRLETRKVIVPGVYGAIQIATVYDDGVNIYSNPGKWSAADLRTAAAVLNELAEALG